MQISNKYIDMNQFPHNLNGTISWKNSVGVVAEFLFNNTVHKLKILNVIDCAHIKIEIDSNIIKTVQSNEIINLCFEKIFYESTYHYDIGQIIDNLEILSKTKKVKSKKYKQKAYECRCIKDGYVFIISECELNRGRRCPLCANKVVVKGINDIATTNPEMIKYLKNDDDAYKYSAQSNKKIKVKCPICGFTKDISICSLYYNGFSCNKCSDGISYANKFAHELFKQLSNQYLDYNDEYSPEWAKKYRYDNYIKLLNGREFIVEMDGGFHYIDKWKHNNDKEKDSLALSHNIKMIRIDCNYNTISERFEYIKNNTFDALKDIFDLSYVDWNNCNLQGISSIILEVINYYNNNTVASYEDIVNHFGICLSTLRSYLRIGDEIGLCKYEKRISKNIILKSKPIAMYDSNNELIGVYSSAKQLEKNFLELNLYKSSVFRAAQNNKMYKGYSFKFVTHDEYQEFINIKF